MQRWKLIVGLVLGAILSIVACHYMLDLTVVPMAANGTGPGGVDVKPAGWLALIMSLIGSGGFSIAAVYQAVRALAEQFAPASAKGGVLAAIDVSELPIYARLYNATTDPIQKCQIRITAKSANDALFERWFPLPVTEGKP